MEMVRKEEEEDEEEHLDSTAGWLLGWFLWQPEYLGPYRWSLGENSVLNRHAGDSDLSEMLILDKNIKSKK